MDNQQAYNRHVYISTDGNRIYIGSRKGSFSDKSNRHYLGSYADKSFQPTDKYCYSEHNSELVAFMIERNLIKCWNMGDRCVNKEGKLPQINPNFESMRQTHNTPEMKRKKSSSMLEWWESMENYEKGNRVCKLQDNYSSWYAQLSDEKRCEYNSKKTAPMLDFQRNNKEIMSQAKRKGWESLQGEDRLKRLPKPRYGKDNQSSKSVETPIGRFESIISASKALGVSRGTLRRWLNSGKDGYSFRD